jgi:hypothetical protein
VKILMTFNDGKKVNLKEKEKFIGYMVKEREHTDYFSKIIICILKFR